MRCVYVDPTTRKMKSIWPLFALGLTAITFFGREVVDLNPGWRFLKADPTGAEAPGFDDQEWESVSAPHTFNDVDTFDNWSLPGHRGEQEQWSGRVWYRKAFEAPGAWRDRKVFIEFEAVRQVAEVYLNGIQLGVAKGGFTPFGFDLTPHLIIGERNVIAVRVDNRFQRDPTEPAVSGRDLMTKATPTLAELSRQLMDQIPETLEELEAEHIPWNNPHWHPAHGGIYRNVRLYVTDPLHITLPLYSFLQTEGPYAYATTISEKSAQVHIEVPLRNDSSAEAKVSVKVRLLEREGREVAHGRSNATVPGKADTKLRLLPIIVDAPRRWEPAQPHFYRVEIELSSEKGIVDRTEVPLGIRNIEWDAASGLWLNGAHYKLHGWGQKSTNEWPGLGAAQPDWLQAYTLKLMKEAGGNFVRWGHVPGGPAQVRAADELGIVTLQPGTDGEHDTKGGAWELRVANFRDVIIYFRNHPSILIWEGGNQKVSREHAAELRAIMDRYDPHGQRAYAHRRADSVTAEFMDIGIGTEGGREIPHLPVVEGEYNREESPRRVWDDFSPPNFGYPEAAGQTYQLTSEQFAVNQVAHYVKKLGASEHAGGANWIFSDSTSGGRVAVEVARTSGEVDGVRLPKEAYFVTQVMFTYEPRIHIIGHWNYPKGTRKTVYVVANTGGDVELRVNGERVGRARAENRFLYRFDGVNFASGRIEAIALDGNGGEQVRTAKETSSEAVALRLTPHMGPDGWRADGSDVVLIDVEAIDSVGRRVPTFQQRVDFQLKGAAIWRGGYNSGKVGSINKLYLDLEAGINRIALRSTLVSGPVVITAQGNGLLPATLELHTVKSGSGPAWPSLNLPANNQRQPPELAPVRGHGPSLAAGQAGRFIRTFNYTAPNAAIVHVETRAAEGKNAYVDVDSPLRGLPKSLVGADWIKTAFRDANYHAVDLIELAVATDAVITIAHDDRVPRPPWLTNSFVANGERIEAAGAVLSLFTCRVARNGSVTLGPNSEKAQAGESAMYLVFVHEP